VFQFLILNLKYTYFVEKLFPLIIIIYKVIKLGKLKNLNINSCKQIFAVLVNLIAK
jgi:hypothetical protein